MFKYQPVLFQIDAVKFCLFKKNMLKAIFLHRFCTLVTSFLGVFTPKIIDFNDSFVNGLLPLPFKSMKIWSSRISGATLTSTI
jgi:hypothetical protein